MPIFPAIQRFLHQLLQEFIKSQGKPIYHSYHRHRYYLQQYIALFLILKTSGGIFWEFSPNLVPLRFPLPTTPFHILSLSYKNKQTKKHPSLKLTSCRKPRTSHCLTDIQATFSENSATRTWISFFPNSKNHLKAVMKTHVLCFSYLKAHALVGQLFLIVMNRYRNLIYDAT